MIAPERYSDLAVVRCHEAREGDCEVESHGNIPAAIVLEAEDLLICLPATLAKEYLPKSRPTHFEPIMADVHTVNGYVGGPYGTVSSHAANCFGLALLSSLPFSPDGVFDMTLASGEALGNAVDHTCGGGVLVTVAAYPDRAIVDVADCGAGFSLGADEEAPEVAADAERGRGIRLMRLLADSVSIEQKSTGEGTVVRLVKLFDASGSLDAPGSSVLA